MERMKDLKKKRIKVTLKVKLEEVDLNNFAFETLVVDDYWSDLYNPPMKDKKKMMIR